MAASVHHLSPSIYEGCALNYQQTSFINALNLSGHTCPPDPNNGNSTSCPASGYCAVGKHDCSNTPLAQGNTVLSYRWIDIDGDNLVDLVASPTKGGLSSYNFYKGDQPFAAPVESPLVFGDFSTSCPAYTATAVSNGDYRVCGGKSPWFFYRNKGNGVFGEPSGLQWPYPTRVLYEPMPLETASGESSLWSYPTGQYQGIVDLDGDGFADGARAFESQQQNPPWSNWAMWRNDKTGLLLPQSSATAFAFNTGTNYGLSRSNWQSGFTNVKSVEGLLDVHGDGLADHWSTDPNVGLTGIAINDGAGLRYPPEIAPTVTPATETTFSCGTLCYDNGNPVRAYRKDASKTIDLDLDGRADVAQSYTGTWTSRLNAGGNFGNPVGTIGWAPGLYRTIVATDQIPPYPGAPAAGSYAWELRSDMIDLDGDGIPEGVNFSDNLDNWFTPQPFQLSKIATPTQPPRLLRGIINGRGAATTITYAAMSNTSVVTQDAAGGKRMPHTQWVVHTVRTIDSVASPQTDGTTTYSYANPVYGPEYSDPLVKDVLDDDRYAFRGFEKVTVTSPSGAKREENYTFAPDWSGRLGKVIVRPAEAPAEARTIDETTWEERTLFCDAPGVNCRLKTYHPVVQKHYVCLNGQTESACSDPASAGGYSQTQSDLTALATSVSGGSSTPLMWQETSSTLQRWTAAQNGDRRFDTEHYLFADGGTYRLVVVSETKLHRVNGAFTSFAKTEHKWQDNGDLSFRVPWTTAVYVNNNFADRLVTARDYDLATGNVTKVWKPAQWAPNQNRSTNLNRTALGYDVRKLFVTNEVNELGHVRDFTYEPGTGTKLGTFGPNAPSCAPNSCPGGTPLREEHRIRVDGLGRMIERYETHGETAQYALYKVETNAYTDSPSPVVIHQSAIEFQSATSTIRYAVDMAELDGHGRPLRTTLLAQGAAAANQVTSYSFNHDGTLAQVTVPDPTANDTSTVAYTYTFDSLGRALTIRRPDALNANDKSGVNVSYNGLAQTSTEVVGIALGQPASTVTRKDVFGRLVQVEEQRSASPIAWSTTNYTYGPDDNVTTIVDPEGVTTSMVHDFAGRRTQITRGTRVWNYGYDANGNLVSEQTPCTGSTCAAAHTTTVAYDALDRPSSKSIAPRAMTTADRTLFGAATETFTWDSGTNAKGRLSQWQSFGPSGGAAVSAAALTYNAQGQETGVTQTTNAAGYTNLSRWFGHRYDISGAVRFAWYNDVVGTTQCQSGSLGYYEYDNRGLLKQVQIQDCVYSPSVKYSYLQNTRNVAGVVTKRNSVQAVGTITYAESNWTYDRLGRVTSQVINKGSPLTQVARQDLEYFGNDDPKWMKHWLGASNMKWFNFGYDSRHQLTSVSETALPNAFTATYTYGNARTFRERRRSCGCATEQRRHAAQRHVHLQQQRSRAHHRT